MASTVVLAAVPTLIAIALDVIILTGDAPTVYVDMVDEAHENGDSP
ncbi:MAG: hypothetical protein S0880_31430 [Actinomycetota bacterium]|nr:hypothetical protein [Actinomycetota bacterium]